LSEARGVYVLTSVATRKHYVGSATGQGGFFERWSGHAKVGGDATGFHRRGPTDYRVSILQVATGFQTEDEILKTEYIWMEKLQSRSMGINGHPSALQQEPSGVTGCGAIDVIQSTPGEYSDAYLRAQ
jgi:hypothetical protein